MEGLVEDLPDGADGIEGQVFIDYSQSEDEEVQNIIQVGQRFYQIKLRIFRYAVSL